MSDGQRLILSGPNTRINAVILAISYHRGLADVTQPGNDGIAGYSRRTLLRRPANEAGVVLEGPHPSPELVARSHVRGAIVASGRATRMPYRRVNHGTERAITVTAIRSLSWPCHLFQHERIPREYA